MGGSGMSSWQMEQNIMNTTKTTNNIHQIYGNIFEHIENYVLEKNKGFSVIVPHVCNNVGVFGAGFVGAINQKYPIVKKNYELLGKYNLGYTQYVEVLKNKEYGHKLIFANMIAQNGTLNKSNPRPLNYYSLSKCMVNINSYICEHFSGENPVQIHCPKFGSGLAGGNWNFIKELIVDIWKNLPVFIYSYNPK